MAGMKITSPDAGGGESSCPCRSGCTSKCIESVSTLSLGCVELSGNGAVTDPLRADLNLSTSAGNLIQCRPDGLFATFAFTETISSLTSSGAGVFVYTDETGTSTPIDICAAVAANCNASLVVNPDGSFTFTDNGGFVTTVPAAATETVTTLTDNGDGTLTYVSEDGTVVSVNLGTETNTSFVNNNDGTVTYTSEDGTASVIDICAIIAANCPAPAESVTTLVANADGSLTYTNESGVAVTTPAATAETTTTLVVNPDGSVTYTNEVGAVTTIPASVGETTTTLVDNGDNTLTYTSEDGSAVTFDICGCNTTIVDNADGTITYTSEDGTAAVIDICAIVTANCPGAAETVTTLVDNGDGTVTHTSEDGTVTTINLGSETTTTFVANADGSFTYTSEDGTVTTIPASAGETVTTFVSNADGTATYTSEDGTQITVCQTCATLVDNANGTAKLTAADGTVCDLPTSIPLKCDGTGFAKGDTYRVLDLPNLTAAFTDDCSDHTDPDCRTDVVFDPDSCQFYGATQTCGIPFGTSRLALSEYLSEDFLNDGATEPFNVPTSGIAWVDATGTLLCSTYENTLCNPIDIYVEAGLESLILTTFGGTAPSGRLYGDSDGFWRPSISVGASAGFTPAAGLPCASTPMSDTIGYHPSNRYGVTLATWNFAPSAMKTIHVGTLEKGGTVEVCVNLQVSLKEDAQGDALFEIQMVQTGWGIPTCP